jgi:predicted permease
MVPHGFAEALWGNAPAAVGKTIELNGVLFAVIGVLAPAVDDRVDVLVPAAAFGPDETTRTAHNWDVAGRLRPGVSIAEARSEMATIAQRLADQYGSETDAAGVEVVSVLDAAVGGMRPAILALMAACCLLILIGCANVANLLLARGVARRQEMALRQALGASRWRVARQLLAESLVLAGAAGVAGVLIAEWSFRSLLALVPYSLPRRGEITIDFSTLALGMAAAVVAGLLFGLVPAYSASRRSLTTPLRSANRSATGGHGGVRRALVVAEFALALVVLTCAGLLSKSFLRLTQVEVGFDYTSTLLAETDVPEIGYTTDAELIALFENALVRLEALPGMEAVGIANSAPLEGRPSGTFEFIDEPGRKGYAEYGVATAGYFDALRLLLIRGRLFEQTDVATSPHVAVINRTAAERFWPGQDPLGKRLHWAGMDKYDYIPLTVVGVVGDIRHRSLTRQPDPEIYVHLLQRPARARNADFVIRSTGDPASLADAVRNEFQQLDALLPMAVNTLRGGYQGALAQPKFQAQLIGFFALCALLLSAVGLFSAMAYAVSRQTREMGIRLALGATPGSLQRQVLRSAVRTGAIGIVLGAALSLAAGRVMAAQLFGVTAHDPAVFLTAALVLGATGLVASYLPARRAARLDPMAALREE